MKYKSGKGKAPKAPGYWTEFSYVALIIATLKLYSEEAFQALGFFTVCIPLMIYLVISLFSSLLKFIQLMHIEVESAKEEDYILCGLLTKKQGKLLLTVAGNLLAYFGIYSLSGYLDQVLVFAPTPDQGFHVLAPALIGLHGAFLIVILNNYLTRKAAVKKGDASGSLFSASGLTTIVNAMTQTTTTLCANGQCFTIYSNTIASNMAAFGVSMTAINTYLVPLCCLLLVYSVWSLYKYQRSLTYKPFLAGLAGAILIALDNFVLGERLNLMNIPSWAGNILLIGGTIAAGRDQSKDTSTASPFGV
jgi:hypothetical protein